MDRILYFRTAGKREFTSNYRVQVFRNKVYGKDIIYLQVCGYPYQEQVECVQGEMQKALERILACGRKDEEPARTGLVYDFSFEKWLESVECASRWRRMWQLPMYDAFYDRANVEHMLSQVPKDAFPQEMWILGYGPDVKAYILQIAGKIRSLTFWVEFVTRSLERLTEELEEELGLVCQVRLVAPGAMKKERFTGTHPVLVLDYSGKESISVIGMCKGSFWLDMDSVESKRHSMEDRKTGIHYISMKKLWKEEMLQTLDTIGNIEYNTEVKLDGLGG